MWIILLDRSGSMGQPFSGKSEFAGRSRQSQSAVKLDAAKEALREHLLGLGSPSPIALFEFTSTASLIFEGMSHDSIGIQQALDRLSANNGTNIAAALTKAFEYANQVQGVSIFRILIISDGLSSQEPAERAARQLESRPSLIDAILIDPTSDGEAVARAIAIGGTVWAVTSPEELAREVGEVGLRQAELAKQAEALMREYEQGAQSVTAREQPEERLSFTAGYPGAVLPETWHPLLVYLHLARLQDEVTERLRQKATQIGLRASISTAESASRLKRGTCLRLTPRVEGLVFNPLSQEVAWYEDIQEVSFRLQADPNVTGRSLLGSVEVYSGPVLIAQIPLSLNVRPTDMPEEAAQTVMSSAQIFNRVFASYSRQDESIVDACVAAYEALGIYVYIDKKSLRGGELWRPMLHKFIRKSDLFQLYWSQSSSQSKNVEDEWQYALQLMNAGNKHGTFIRPLRWEEDWPDPPKKLSPINFARLDLFALERYTNQTIPTAIKEHSIQKISHANYPTLPVTVVPILPSASSESQGIILEDVVYAVNFLEETTGLRYYPVPTLLVDEFITKSVRTINTIDLDPITPSDELKERIFKLNDILSSIALEFHCRHQGLYPHSETINLEQLDSAFGKGSMLSEDQFHRISDYCEGSISAAVEEYIQPSWLQARVELGSRFPDLNVGHSYSDFILCALDYAIKTAKNDYRRWRGNFSLWSKKEQHAAELLQDELTQIGITVSKRKNKDLELSGSFSAFSSALKMFHTELSTNLQHYNNCDITLPSDPTPCGERYQAIGVLVEKIVRQIGNHDSSVYDVGRWLNEILNPSWRELCNELVSLKIPNINSHLDFVDFLDNFLKTISMLLEEGLRSLGDFDYEGGYSIKVDSWELLQKEISDLQLNVKLPESCLSRKQSVLLRGQFSEFVRVFKITTTKLIEALSKITHLNTPIQQLFAVEVPTYGIYAPANCPDSDDRLKHWAFERGIATELTLSNTPRVLFSLDAQERFEEKLQREVERQKSSRLAREFQRSVLVHEHFHAILETGLDEKRSSAPSSKFKKEAWQTAFCLNESLAVWMELHAARQNQELMALIWDYIRADSYPNWPYRGAEKVEEIYQQEGIEGLRELIANIRKDPESAQAYFDSPGPLSTKSIDI